MIRSITYVNRLNYPQTVVMDVLEEDKKYLYGKRLHDGHPLLIPKKDIREDKEAKPEKIKEKL